MTWSARRRPWSGSNSLIAGLIPDRPGMVGPTDGPPRRADAFLSNSAEIIGHGSGGPLEDRLFSSPQIPTSLPSLPSVRVRILEQKATKGMSRTRELRRSSSVKTILRTCLGARRRARGSAGGGTSQVSRPRRRADRGSPGPPGPVRSAREDLRSGRRRGRETRAERGTGRGDTSAARRLAPDPMARTLICAPGPGFRIGT
jgi:hypothetical protein